MTDEGGYSAGEAGYSGEGNTGGEGAGGGSGYGGGYSASEAAGTPPSADTGGGGGDGYIGTPGSGQGMTAEWWANAMATNDPSGSSSPGGSPGGIIDATFRTAGAYTSPSDPGRYEQFAVRDANNVMTGAYNPNPSFGFGGASGKAIRDAFVQTNLTANQLTAINQNPYAPGSINAFNYSLADIRNQVTDRSLATYDAVAAKEGSYAAQTQRILDATKVAGQDKQWIGLNVGLNAGQNAYYDRKTGGALGWGAQKINTPTGSFMLPGGKNAREQIGINLQYLGTAIPTDANRMLSAEGAKNFGLNKDWIAASTTFLSAGVIPSYTPGTVSDKSGTVFTGTGWVNMDSKVLGSAATFYPTASMPTNPYSTPTEKPGAAYDMAVAAAASGTFLDQKVQDKAYAQGYRGDMRGMVAIDYKTGLSIPNMVMEPIHNSHTPGGTMEYDPKTGITAFVPTPGEDPRGVQVTKNGDFYGTFQGHDSTRTTFKGVDVWLNTASGDISVYKGNLNIAGASRNAGQSGKFASRLNGFVPVDQAGNILWGELPASGQTRQDWLDRIANPTSFSQGGEAYYGRSLRLDSLDPLDQSYGKHSLNTIQTITPSYGSQEWKNARAYVDSHVGTDKAVADFGSFGNQIKIMSFPKEDLNFASYMNRGSANFLKGDPSGAAVQNKNLVSTGYDIFNVTPGGDRRTVAGGYVYNPIAPDRMVRDLPKERITNPYAAITSDITVIGTMKDIPNPAFIEGVSNPEEISRTLLVSGNDTILKGGERYYPQILNDPKYGIAYGSVVSQQTEAQKATSREKDILYNINRAERVADKKRGLDAYTEKWYDPQPWRLEVNKDSGQMPVNSPGGKSSNDISLPRLLDTTKATEGSSNYQITDITKSVIMPVPAKSNKDSMFTGNPFSGVGVSTLLNVNQPQTSGASFTVIDTSPSASPFALGGIPSSKISESSPISGLTFSIIGKTNLNQKGTTDFSNMYPNKISQGEAWIQNIPIVNSGLISAVTIGLVPQLEESVVNWQVENIPTSKIKNVPIFGDIAKWGSDTYMTEYNIGAPRINKPAGAEYSRTLIGDDGKPTQTLDIAIGEPMVSIGKPTTVREYDSTGGWVDTTSTPTTTTQKYETKDLSDWITPVSSTTTKIGDNEYTRNERAWVDQTIGKILPHELPESSRAGAKQFLSITSVGSSMFMNPVLSSIAVDTAYSTYKKGMNKPTDIAQLALAAYIQGGVFGYMGEGFSSATSAAMASGEFSTVSKIAKGTVAINEKYIPTLFYGTIGAAGIGESTSWGKDFNPEHVSMRAGDFISTTGISLYFLNKGMRLPTAIHGQKVTEVITKTTNTNAYADGYPVDQYGFPTGEVYSMRNVNDVIPPAKYTVANPKTGELITYDVNPKTGAPYDIFEFANPIPKPTVTTFTTTKRVGGIFGEGGMIDQSTPVLNNALYKIASFNPANVESFGLRKPPMRPKTPEGEIPIGTWNGYDYERTGLWKDNGAIDRLNQQVYLNYNVKPYALEKSSLPGYMESYNPGLVFKKGSLTTNWGEHMYTKEVSAYPGFDYTTQTPESKYLAEMWQDPVGVNRAGESRNYIGMIDQSPTRRIENPTPFSFGGENRAILNDLLGYQASNKVQSSLQSETAVIYNLRSGKRVATVRGESGYVSNAAVDSAVDNLPDVMKGYLGLYHAHNPPRPFPLTRAVGRKISMSASNWLSGKLSGGGFLESIPESIRSGKEDVKFFTSEGVWGSPSDADIIQARGGGSGKYKFREEGIVSPEGIKVFKTKGEVLPFDEIYKGNELYSSSEVQAKTFKDLPTRPRDLYDSYKSPEWSERKPIKEIPEYKSEPLNTDVTKWKMPLGNKELPFEHKPIEFPPIYESEPFVSVAQPIKSQPTFKSSLSDADLKALMDKVSKPIDIPISKEPISKPFWADDPIFKSSPVYVETRADAPTTVKGGGIKKIGRQNVESSFASSYIDNSLPSAFKLDKYGFPQSVGSSVVETSALVKPSPQSSLTKAKPVRPYIDNSLTFKLDTSGFVRTTFGGRSTQVTSVSATTTPITNPFNKFVYSDQSQSSYSTPMGEMRMMSMVSGQPSSKTKGIVTEEEFLTALVGVAGRSDVKARSRSANVDLTNTYESTKLDTNIVSKSYSNTKGISTTTPISSIVGLSVQLSKVTDLPSQRTTSKSFATVTSIPDIIGTTKSSSIGRTSTGTQKTTTKLVTTRVMPPILPDLSFPPFGGQPEVSPRRTGRRTHQEFIPIRSSLMEMFTPMPQQRAAPRPRSRKPSKRRK